MDNKISIAWVDMTFSVKPFIWSKEKIIINKINGYFNFGSLNALMGSTGAGKTTLLKCLSGRHRSGLGNQTQIYLSSTDKIRTCFINQVQKEHLILSLTVKQSLVYASYLKNSGKHLNIDHESNVKNLMNELMISDIEDTIVGKCSGGEQKRIVIALELTSVIKPNMLFIDEPTTGLDSDSAENVIKCLKTLSLKHNMTVIASIHQPNNDLLVMFDKLYVLAKGGICVYSGRPQDLDKHLKQYGIAFNENQIPIEGLLKCSSKGMNDSKTRQMASKNSKEKYEILSMCKNKTKLFPNGIHVKTMKFKVIDIWYLLLRIMTYTYLSQWKFFIAQLLVYMLYGLILSKLFDPNIGRTNVCFSFNKTNTKCETNFKDEMILHQNEKFNLVAGLTVMFIQLTITTITFTTEMKIFLNEHINRWYSTGSYYWAKTIVETQQTIIISFFYSPVVYFMSEQITENNRYFGYLYLITIAMLCTQSLGNIIGIIFGRNIKLALAIGAAIYINIMLFCNFFLPIRELSPLLQRFSDLTYTKLLFNSILTLLYGFNRCPSGQLSLALYEYNIETDETFWTNSKQLFIHFLVLRFLALIAILIKSNPFLFHKRSRIDTLNHEELKKYENVISIEDESFDNRNDENSIHLSSEINTKQIHDVNMKNKELAIAWIDLTFTIPKTIFTEGKTILNGISGGIDFGSLNALMGPSGAGKTTLLSSINGIIKSGLSNETKIYLSSKRKIRTCFINQEISEHLLAGLTAKQSLVYSSKLKNCDKPLDHKLNAENLMNELMISDISDTVVEKCSGGQQKRIAIALELTSITKPNMLCIDEPTSGLDSDAAEVVTKCLKNLSLKHNIAIVTSIHQPNSDLLLMFDKLYVLAKGGLCLFYGRPGKLEKCLSDCGIPINRYQSPIEEILKICSKGANNLTVKQLSNKNCLKREKLLTRAEKEAFLSRDGIQFRSKRFKLIDLWYLVNRTTIYTIRSQWKALITLFLFSNFCCYFMAKQYNPDMGKADGCINITRFFAFNCQKEIESLEDRFLMIQNTKYIFMVLLLMIFLQIFITTLTFPPEIRIFLNEQRNGWYSTGAYYWAKCIVEIVPTIITIISYCFVSMFSTDSLGDIEKLPTFLYIMIFSCFCSQSLGTNIGIIFNKNVNIAVLVTVSLTVLKIVFSNIIITLHQTHYFIQWFSRLNPLNIALDSIFYLIYGSNRCKSNQVSIILHMFRLNEEDFWAHLRFLFIFFIILRFIALLILIIKANKLHLERSPENLHNKEVQTSNTTDDCIRGLRSQRAYKSIL